MQQHMPGIRIALLEAHTVYSRLLSSFCSGDESLWAYLECPGYFQMFLHASHFEGCFFWKAQVPETLHAMVNSQVLSKEAHGRSHE